MYRTLNAEIFLSTLAISPRDDLYCLAVTLIVLLAGQERLPWYQQVNDLQSQAASTQSYEQYEQLASLKEQALPPKLAEDLPAMAVAFYDYARTLAVDTKPDYVSWWHGMMHQKLPELRRNSEIPVCVPMFHHMLILRLNDMQEPLVFTVLRIEDGL